MPNFLKRGGMTTIANRPSQKVVMSCILLALITPIVTQKDAVNTNGGMTMIPEEGRWVCNDCGHVFYESEPAMCDECGSQDIEEVGDDETYDHT